MVRLTNKQRNDKDWTCLIWPRNNRLSLSHGGLADISNSGFDESLFQSIYQAIGGFQKISLFGSVSVGTQQQRLRMSETGK